MFLLSYAEFFKINFFKKFYQENGVDPDQSWSGSKLFAKVVSRQQKVAATKDSVKLLSVLRRWFCCC